MSAFYQGRAALRGRSPQSLFGGGGAGRGSWRLTAGGSVSADRCEGVPAERSEALSGTGTPGDPIMKLPVGLRAWHGTGLLHRSS